MSETSDPVQEFNKQLVLPPDAYLYSKDGRVFGITRWCPKVEKGREVRFEMECVELHQNNFHAKQKKLQQEAIDACVEIHKAIVRLAGEFPETFQ